MSEGGIGGIGAALLSSTKAHDFQKTVFTKPVNCIVCHKKIWSLLKSEYACSACGTVTHKKCMQQASSTNCHGKPPKEFSLQHETNSLVAKIESSLFKDKVKSKSGDPKEKKSVGTFTPTNRLAVSPDNTQIYLAAKDKVHMFDIDTSSKNVLQFVKSIASLPNARIREIACYSVPNSPADIPVLIVSTTRGVLVYRRDQLDSTPVVLGLSQSIVAISIRGQSLAAGTAQKQVLIWNMLKELEKKPYSTESIVADDFIVDIELNGDSTKLMILSVDGKFRVYALGVMRGIIAERDMFAPKSQARMKLMGEVVIISDQADELKAFNANKATAATMGDFATTSPSILDSSLLAKIKIFRIPSPGASTAASQLLMEFSHSLKVAFCCSTQTGKVDIVQVSPNDNKVLKSTGSVGDFGNILGMTVVETPEFILLYTFYDSYEVYCYAINRTTYLRQPTVSEVDAIRATTGTAPELGRARRISQESGGTAAPDLRVLRTAQSDMALLSSRAQTPASTSPTSPPKADPTTPPNSFDMADFQRALQGVDNSQLMKRLSTPQATTPPAQPTTPVVAAPVTHGNYSNFLNLPPQQNTAPTSPGAAKSSVTHGAYANFLNLPPQQTTPTATPTSPSGSYANFLPNSPNTTAPQQPPAQAQPHGSYANFLPSNASGGLATSGGVAKQPAVGAYANFLPTNTGGLSSSTNSAPPPQSTPAVTHSNYANFLASPAATNPPPAAAEPALNQSSQWRLANRQIIPLSNSSFAPPVVADATAPMAHPQVQVTAPPPQVPAEQAQPTTVVFSYNNIAPGGKTN